MRPPVTPYHPIIGTMTLCTLPGCVGTFEADVTLAVTATLHYSQVSIYLLQGSVHLLQDYRCTTNMQYLAKLEDAHILKYYFTN